MLSVARAAGADGYYTRDANYYSQEGERSAWSGKGAEALGLTGEVDEQLFRAIQAGKLPNGLMLGRTINGEQEHAPGWDLTFSAPKSVSLAALLGGDQRLIDAVRQATRVATSWMEENAAYVRVTEKRKAQSVNTGKLLTATFFHEMSRELDPQLHAHVVVMNASQGPDGKWRSLDSRHFYWLAKQGGLRFQESLARQVRELGYEIVINTRSGTFEIAGHSREAIEAFSKRLTQINKDLASKGLTRDKATITDRNRSARITRRAKQTDIDRPSLMQKWRELAHAVGLDVDKDHQEAVERSKESFFRSWLQRADVRQATEAVRRASAILAEKNITFSHGELVRKANELSFGQAADHLSKAITAAEKAGWLHAREVRRYDRLSSTDVQEQGWTTTDAIKTERAILRLAGSTRLLSMAYRSSARAEQAIVKATERQGPLPADHAQLVKTLLTSKQRLITVDGSLASESNQRALSVYLGSLSASRLRLMAPSGAGAKALGKITGVEAATLAKHLHGVARNGAGRRETWVVGDAMRLRASAIEQLLTAANQQKARVVLLGDSERGVTEAFDLLRNGTMSVLTLPKEQALTDIDQLRAELSEGKTVEAMTRIEQGGGRLVSIGPSSRSPDEVKAATAERHKEIAKTYAALPESKRIATRVLSLQHSDKDQLNVAIRGEMKAKRLVVGSELTLPVLVRQQSLSPTEREFAGSYKPGQVVQFTGGQLRKGIKPGDYLTVKEVQAEKGRVILSTSRNRSISWQPAQWGAEGAAIYVEAERAFAAGDRIVWTKSSRDFELDRNDRGTILTVNPGRQTITLKDDGLIERTISLKQHRHIEYGYAETVMNRAADLPDQSAIVHFPASSSQLSSRQQLIDAVGQVSDIKGLTIVTENAARLAHTTEDREGRTVAAIDVTQGERSIASDAMRAVRIAVDMKAERSSVFSDEDLIQKARSQGIGYASESELRQAIEALAEAGKLVSRVAPVYDMEAHKMVPGQGWSSLESLTDERRLLAAEERSRGAFTGREILSHLDAIRVVNEAAITAEHPWSQARQSATIGLLTSPHRVTALQGFAGVGKTTTVLKVLAEMAEKEGYDVKAMAPTGLASHKLGDANRDGMDLKTAQKHLGLTKNVNPEDGAKPQVWLVDETSQVSARDMLVLLRVAEQYDARIYLAGDLMQMTSVGAGRVFAQLQEAGMPTEYLVEIVRQRGQMREAIEDMILGNPGEALDKIQDLGTVLEIESAAKRYEAVADAYISRLEAGEKSLVVVPTRRDVEEVNKAIRAGLESKGRLQGPALDVTLLVDVGLTQPERSAALSYQPGQIIRFTESWQGRPDLRIEAGSYLKVKDVRDGRLTLDAGLGDVIWDPRVDRRHTESFDVKATDVKGGDDIIWTKNNHELDLLNGERAKVVEVDPDSHRITIAGERGQDVDLDLRNMDHQHFAHAYGVTTHKAQSATMTPIVLAPSYHLHTVNDRSLYVGLSRTPDQVTLITDDVQTLKDVLMERDSRQEAALDQSRPKPVRDAEATISERLQNHQRDRDQGMSP